MPIVSQKSEYSAKENKEDSFLEFDQAFRKYKKNNKLAETYDQDSIRIFTEKKIGKRKASEKEFFEVFSKY